MESGTKRISKRLILSYVVDWVIILAIAAVGAAFSAVTPNKRPFNITDPEISFPYIAKEKVSTGLLVVIGLVIPGAIVFIISLFVGVGPASGKPASKTKLWQRKLWEWNAGWMGLGLSLAIAFLITDGTKNLVGKPRPDLLSRCNADLSRLLSSSVGGIGDQVDEGINLVSSTICRNPGSTLDDGFRSFPSGHSSFSFAGLTYLALFLCAKLAITIPVLNYKFLGHSNYNGHSLRKQAAAAPTYLIVVPLIPICAAIYVSSTRYSDFRHHGFDIISGAILGIVSAWVGFRWYHLPINRGGGWAWAPRTYDRAFGRGIGVLTYGSDDTGHNKQPRDLESGPYRTGNADGGNLVGPYRTSDGSEEIRLDDLTNTPGTAIGSDSSQRPIR